MAVITIEGLTKRFGDVVAVDDLSFEVDQGTVVGFLGPCSARGGRIQEVAFSWTRHMLVDSGHEDPSRPMRIPAARAPRRDRPIVLH
jgi:ABC-type phosphonate transport system ATPase subunit